MSENARNSVFLQPLKLQVMRQLLNWHVRSCWKFLAPNGCCPLPCRVVRPCGLVSSWLWERNQQIPTISIFLAGIVLVLDSSRNLVMLRMFSSTKKGRLEVYVALGPLMSSGGALIFPMPQSTQAMLRPSGWHLKLDVPWKRWWVEMCWASKPAKSYTMKFLNDDDSNNNNNNSNNSNNNNNNSNCEGCFYMFLLWK